MLRGTKCSLWKNATPTETFQTQSLLQEKWCWKDTEGTELFIHPDLQYITPNQISVFSINYNSHSTTPATTDIFLYKKSSNLILHLKANFHFKKKISLTCSQNFACDLFLTWNLAVQRWTFCVCIYKNMRTHSQTAEGKGKGQGRGRRKGRKEEMVFL